MRNIKNKIQLLEERIRQNEEQLHEAKKIRAEKLFFIQKVHRLNQLIQINVDCL